MEDLLKSITDQTVKYAIRSGISTTASFVFAQSVRLLKNVDDIEDRHELLDLQRRLDKKIQIISPSIDMIEMIAARGNTSLESAVSLTKDIRRDIQVLGCQIEKVAASEESVKSGAKLCKSRAQNDAEIKRIIKDVKVLLGRIEDAVPLMNLAITTSGAKLSASLPSTVSPSRLLQASTFLSAGDTQYSLLPSRAVQVGPTFTLSVYMLFASHVRRHDEEGIRATTWKEVIHKSRIKLQRVPMDSVFAAGGQLRNIPAEAKADEFEYQLLIIEDLDDGRVHTLEGSEQRPVPYDDVAEAGMREVIPVYQISKIFYADTGKILNINPEGELNRPVLLLKRDVDAIPPRRMMGREGTSDGESELRLEQDFTANEDQAQLNAQLGITYAPVDSTCFRRDSIPEECRLPQGLDPEWVAFEVYSEDEQVSDTESEVETPIFTTVSGTGAVSSEMIAGLSLDPKEQLSLPRDQELTQYDRNISQKSAGPMAINPAFAKVRTSLSLLETLLRLTSLQQFQQQSHLSISDELLNFFLEESSTTGAGGDEQHRQRVRAAARGKVGFDPFDESPIKRRGEDRIYRRPSGSTPLHDDTYSPPLSSIHSRSREGTPATPISTHLSSSMRPNASNMKATRDSPS